MAQKKIPLVDSYNFIGDKPVFNSSSDENVENMIKITNKSEAGKDFNLNDIIIFEKTSLSDYDLTIIKFKNTYYKRNILFKNNFVHFFTNNADSTEIVIENDLLDEVLIGKLKQVIRSLDNE